MPVTEALPIIKKRPISAEEYRKLKRRDLALRCQYVRIIQNQKKSKNIVEYSKRIRKLEKRIAELELRLAYSELILPEPVPMKAKDVAVFAMYYLKSIWHYLIRVAMVKKLATRYLH